MSAAFGADLWHALAAQWRDLRRVVTFSDTLSALPAWLAPGLALGSLLALVVLSGVALAALGALLTAVLAAALVLEGVFGVRVAVSLPA